MKKTAKPKNPKARFVNSFGTNNYFTQQFLLHGCKKFRRLSGEVGFIENSSRTRTFNWKSNLPFKVGINDVESL